MTSLRDALRVLKAAGHEAYRYPRLPRSVQEGPDLAGDPGWVLDGARVTEAVLMERAAAA